jgi:hypothetical protein
LPPLLTFGWIFFTNFDYILCHKCLQCKIYLCHYFAYNFSLILGSWGDWEVEKSKEDDGRSCKTILTNLEHLEHASILWMILKILLVFWNLFRFDLVYLDDDTSLISKKNKSTPSCTSNTPVFNYTCTLGHRN